MDGGLTAAADRAAPGAGVEPQAGTDPMLLAKKLLELESLRSQERMATWFAKLGRRWVKEYLRAEAEAERNGQAITPATLHGQETANPNVDAERLLNRMVEKHGRGTPGHTEDAAATLMAWANTMADIVRSHFVTSNLARLRRAVEANGEVLTMESIPVRQAATRLTADIAVRFGNGSSFTWRTETTWSEGHNGTRLETRKPAYRDAIRSDGTPERRPTQHRIQSGL